MSAVDLKAIRAACEEALAETNPIIRSRRADEMADDYLDPPTVLLMVAVCEAAVKHQQDMAEYDSADCSEIEATVRALLDVAGR